LPEIEIRQPGSLTYLMVERNLQQDLYRLRFWVVVAERCVTNREMQIADCLRDGRRSSEVEAGLDRARKLEKRFREQLAETEGAIERLFRDVEPAA
jgi:hypothetical protein